METYSSQYLSARQLRCTKKMLVFEDLDAFHVVLRRKAQLSYACYYTQHLILSSSPYQGFLFSGIEMRPNQTWKKNTLEKLAS